MFELSMNYASGRDLPIDLIRMTAPARTEVRPTNCKCPRLAAALLGAGGISS
jgi:hypothetical protein